MIIAKEKKRTNIVEYVIYMWQVEDMIRAFDFDCDKLYNSIYKDVNYPKELVKEIHDWYDNIAEMMRIEGTAKKGHVQVIKNVVDDLTDLHFFLINTEHNEEYSKLVLEAANNFVDFRKLNNIDNEVSDVELAFIALYGLLILRLNKREISKETLTAFTSFSKVLTCLSVKYKEREEKRG